MHIEQFRVVVRAADFDRSCRFYAEVLALPQLKCWDGRSGRGALFQAGTGIVELLAAPRGNGSEVDEAFTFHGPKHKLSLTMIVASAEQAYEELIFRDRNIPGGLKTEPDGSIIFETQDPDGVRVTYREKA